MYTSNQLADLWKESLNSVGHQFHQYQQNEQSPTYNVVNPDPGKE
jgi:hypothetical protein